MKKLKKCQVGGKFSNTGYLPDSPDRFNEYNVIPSNIITMDTVPHDVLAIPDKGKPKLMKKNSGLHKFINATQVTEIPMMQVGGSIVDTLKSKNRDASFGSRAALAKQMGIQNYRGTPEQNMQMLKLIDNPSPAPAKAPAKKAAAKPTQQTGYNKPIMNLSDYENYAQGYDNRNLESGIITDKGTNLTYVVDKGKVVKKFPVLTGKNRNVNINNESFETLDVNKSARGTPTGIFNLTPDGDLYGEPGFRLNSIDAFGEQTPATYATAYHTTYDSKNRGKLYNKSAEDRRISYGCINCEKPNINYMTNKFPSGDTAIIIDSKNKRDAQFLNKFTPSKQAGGPFFSPTGYPMIADSTRVNHNLNLAGDVAIRNNQANRRAAANQIPLNDPNFQPVPHYTYMSGNSAADSATYRTHFQDALNNSDKVNRLTGDNKSILDADTSRINPYLQEAMGSGAGYMGMKMQNAAAKDAGAQITQYNKNRRPVLQSGGSVLSAGLLTGGLSLLNDELSRIPDRRIQERMMNRGGTDAQFQTYTPTNKRGFIDMNTGSVAPDQQTYTQFANRMSPEYYGQLPIAQMGLSAGLSPELVSGALPVFNTEPMMSIPAAEQQMQQPMVDSPDDSSAYDELKKFVKKQEGFTDTARWDYKQFTNGYGTKASANGEKITRAEAEARLDRELLPTYKKIQSSIKAPLKTGQLAALSSIAYNAGFGNVKKLINQINKGADPAQIADMIKSTATTVNNGAQVLPGLVSRRKKEANLFTRSYKEGGTYDLSPSEIQDLIDKGYQVEYQ